MTEKLRKSQTRILGILAKAKGPLPKHRINEIAAKDYPTAQKHTAWMADAIGSLDPATAKKAQERCGYPSLLTLKLIRHVETSVEGKTEHGYEITASGRKALEKTEAPAKPKKAPKAKKEAVAPAA